MNNLGVLKSRNGQFSLFKIVFLEIELSSNVSKSSSKTLEKWENLLTWLNVKTGLHVLLLFLYIVKAWVRCSHNYFFFNSVWQYRTSPYIARQCHVRIIASNLTCKYWPRQKRFLLSITYTWRGQATNYKRKSMWFISDIFLVMHQMVHYFWDWV